MHEPPWVAIIDDDEAIRKSLDRLLRCAGIRAVALSSAEEFLDRSPGADPACILLDFQLGSGLNGVELWERLEATGRLLPIVFVTGRPDDPRLQALAAGRAVEILRKPFETEDVLARVRRHLNGAPSTTRS